MLIIILSSVLALLIGLVVGFILGAAGYAAHLEADGYTTNLEVKKK